jgi:hypothetical protein
MRDLKEGDQAGAATPNFIFAVLGLFGKQNIMEDRANASENHRLVTLPPAPRILHPPP